MKKIISIIPLLAVMIISCSADNLLQGTNSVNVIQDVNDLIDDQDPTDTTDTAEPPPVREVISRIPYIEGEDININQTVDIYIPTMVEGPVPVILAFHGGGFQGRSNRIYTQPSLVFNNMGYAVVAANYRLTPTFTYPSQIKDAVCALAWLHAEGENYGLDTSRVIIMGDSAGGYLAALLAMHDDLSVFLEGCPYALPDGDHYQAAVTWFAYYDWTNESLLIESEIHRVLEPLWGRSYEDMSLEELESMSPIHWLDGSEKPMLLIHGTEDATVPVEQALLFAEAAEELGLDVKLFLPELDHGFITFPVDDPRVQEVYHQIQTFLESLSQ